jgi:hypothetical protein
MIRAMGGQLKIESVFPEGKVEINQFRKLNESRRGRLKDDAHAELVVPTLQKA